MSRKSPYSKMNSELIHKQRQLKKGLTGLAEKVKEIQKDLKSYKQCVRQDFEDTMVLSYFPLVTYRVLPDSYQVFDKTGRMTCSIRLDAPKPESRFYPVEGRNDWLDLNTGKVLEKEKTIHGFDCVLLVPDMENSKNDTTEPRPFYASKTPQARYDGGVFKAFLRYSSSNEFACNLQTFHKQIDDFCFCLPTLGQAMAMYTHIEEAHDSFWIINPDDMNFKGYPIHLFSKTILENLDSESLVRVFNINRQPGINRDVPKLGWEQYKTYPYAPIYPVFNIL